MPVLVERNRGPLSQFTVNNKNQSKSSKKKRKGKKSKVRKQYVSMINFSVPVSGNFRAEDSESNCYIKHLYRPMAQSNMEHSNIMSAPRLPQLPATARTSRTPTPTPSLSCQSCTSCTNRSIGGCRLPITLPLNKQPGAHERRRKLPILAAIKPENERAERERFMRANYNYNPLFIYRFPADADVLERLGKPSDKYLSQAILIMETAMNKYGSYEVFEEETGGKILQRSQIMMLIQRYLKRENLEREVNVNLSEDLLSRGSMTRVKGKPMLNVRVVNLRENWVEGLLRHELGTHYLRSFNNRYQEWYNWKVRKDLNMKPMNPTEEGLASLHSVLLRKEPSLWRAALLYYVAYKAAFLSLKELFRDVGKFVTDPLVRWDYCIRAKRGQVDTSVPGGFCKDQVYLEGALQLLKNRRSIDFHHLVQMGKISWEDIPKIELLANVEDTKVPFFMQDLTQYHKYLDRICDANGLTEDVLDEV